MMNPRMFIKSTRSISLCAVAILFFGGTSFMVRAQQTTANAPDDLKQGLELYKQGDDKAAIEALRRATKKNKNEVGAWYALALCYTRQGKTNDARKAYEKAATSGERLVEQIYDYEPTSAAALKYKPLFLMAIESAKKYLELSPKLSPSKVQEWRERAEMLEDYATFSEEATGPNPFKAYTTKEVETKARIISRPEPQYTDEARAKQVTGTVVLRAIFAFDGRVRGIRVVRGVAGGLTLMAIRAARQIRFIPATVNGKPVSQYIQIEYNFNLY